MLLNDLCHRVCVWRAAGASLGRALCPAPRAEGLQTQGLTQTPPQASKKVLAMQQQLEAAPEGRGLGSDSQRRGGRTQANPAGNMGWEAAGPCHLPLPSDTVSGKGWTLVTQVFARKPPLSLPKSR